MLYYIRHAECIAQCACIHIVTVFVVQTLNRNIKKAIDRGRHCNFDLSGLAGECTTTMKTSCAVVHSYD